MCPTRRQTTTIRLLSMPTNRMRLFNTQVSIILLRSPPADTTVPLLFLRSLPTTTTTFTKRTLPPTTLLLAKLSTTTMFFLSPLPTTTLFLSPPPHTTAFLSTPPHTTALLPIIMLDTMALLSTPPDTRVVRGRPLDTILPSTPPDTMLLPSTQTSSILNLSPLRSTTIRRKLPGCTHTICLPVLDRMSKTMLHLRILLKDLTTLLQSTQLRHRTRHLLMRLNPCPSLHGSHTSRHRSLLPRSNMRHLQNQHIRLGIMRHRP